MDTLKGVKPLYQHDCKECIFLGNYACTGSKYDLYVHPYGSTAIIARWGDDGPDYMSGWVFAKVQPALAEAKRRTEIFTDVPVQDQ